MQSLRHLKTGETKVYAQPIDVWKKPYKWNVIKKQYSAIPNRTKDYEHISDNSVYVAIKKNRKLKKFLNELNFSKQEIKKIIESSKTNSTRISQSGLPYRVVMLNAEDIIHQYIKIILGKGNGVKGMQVLLKITGTN